MNWRRSWLIGLGAVGAGFALAVADPSLPASLNEDGYLLVVALAIVVVIVGSVDLAERTATEADTWQPTDTERGYRVGVPGDELAELRDTELRQRLHDRAVASLMDVRNYSRVDAEHAVESGEWTDDRLAAVYLGSERVRIGPREWLRGMLRGEPTEERAVRRTVRALRRLRGEASER